MAQRRHVTGRLSKYGLLVFCFLVLCVAGAIAGPKGAGSGSPNATSSNNGGQSSGGATGPAAPTTQMPTAFRSFYIVVDGSEPGFNTYATQLIARQLGDDFLVPPVAQLLPHASLPKPPLFIVAATGWTQDTLTNACLSDPDAVGGLVVKFTSFYVESNYLFYATEQQHITPTIFYVSCSGGHAYVATPPVTIYTMTSKSQTTYPVAPYAAMGSLFTYKGGTGAIQVSTNVLVLTTVVSALSGNVGYYNQGREAYSVARQIKYDASALTGYACAGRFLPPYDQPQPNATGTAPPDLLDKPVLKQLEDALANLRESQLVYFHLLPTPYPSSSPVGGAPAQQAAAPVDGTISATISGREVKIASHFQPVAVPTPAPPVPTPTPIPPLENICSALSIPSPSPHP